MGTTLNEKPFQHTGPHGTELMAERCDFQGGARLIIKNTNLSEEMLVQDVAAIIGFHAGNILPDLNWFAGYDCIDFKIVRPSD